MEKGTGVTGEMEKALSKIRYFEEKHRISLGEIETHGLPDDADYKMHEDYVMWRHWAGVANKAKRNMDVLEEIAQQGLSLGETRYAGH